VQTNNKQNTRDYSATAVVGSADDGCDFWHREYSNPELALSEIFDCAFQHGDCGTKSVFWT